MDDMTDVADEILSAFRVEKNPRSADSITDEMVLVCVETNIELKAIRFEKMPLPAFRLAAIMPWSATRVIQETVDAFRILFPFICRVEMAGSKAQSAIEDKLLVVARGMPLSNNSAGVAVRT
jgi:hypothetical protein